MMWLFEDTELITGVQLTDEDGILQYSHVKCYIYAFDVQL